MLAWLRTATAFPLTLNEVEPVIALLAASVRSVPTAVPPLIANRFWAISLELSKLSEPPVTEIGGEFPRLPLRFNAPPDRVTGLFPLTFKFATPPDTVIELLPTSAPAIDNEPPVTETDPLPCRVPATVTEPAETVIAPFPTLPPTFTAPPVS